MTNYNKHLSYSEYGENFAKRRKGFSTENPYIFYVIRNISHAQLMLIIALLPLLIPQEMFRLRFMCVVKVNVSITSRLVNLEF